MLVISSHVVVRSAETIRAMWLFTFRVVTNSPTLYLFIHVSILA